MRSETQATDSTRRGCTAKSAATTKERRGAPVREARTKKSSAAFSACSPAAWRWWPAGSIENNDTSIMWLIHVSGCQLHA